MKTNVRMMPVPERKFNRIHHLAWLLLNGKNSALSPWMLQHIVVTNIETKKQESNNAQRPLLEEMLPDLGSLMGPLVVLLMIPFPKYSAITENPSFELFTCWKNWSWSLEFCSKLLFVSRTDLYSGAHSGHSFSLSPRQRWWNECIHIKCTAGRSSVKVQAVHLLSWNILAFVLRSWTSFLIANVSSCKLNNSFNNFVFSMNKN